MSKKMCPLAMLGVMANPHGEDIYGPHSIDCIEDRCQWWIGAYEREKGAGYEGRDKIMGTQNCAIVILAQKNAEGVIDV